MVATAASVADYNIYRIAVDADNSHDVRDIVPNQLARRLPAGRIQEDGASLLTYISV